MWNPKARKWCIGRRNQFSRLQTASGDWKGKTVWMHCASLGEFEQGRPVLETIKKQYPAARIVLSFFSPSGFEIRKNYSGADIVCYLPMDDRINAKRFLKIIQPTLVIWVKYDYWYYFLREINRRKIPLLLIAANFRASQPFFKWYGGLWKKMLGYFTQIFVQTHYSVELLQEINVTSRVRIAGDPRFDRVISIAEENRPLPDFIQKFTGNSTTIVAGSTWPEDELQWIHFVEKNPGIKFIFAPHETDEQSIREVLLKFPTAIRYSEMEDHAEFMTNVMVVDNVGNLAFLYKLAHIAYVGGGFNESGIHNTLEAAVYGIPVVFGPQYEKFMEARGLIACGGAKSTNLPTDLEKIVSDYLNNDEKRIAAGKAAKDFVYAHRGATKAILKYIQENRLLMS